MKYLKLFIGVLALIIVQVSNAQQRQGERPEKPSATQLLSDLDTNSDSKLSKEETRGPLAEDFSSIDSDNNGYLTLNELNKALETLDRRPPRQQELAVNLSNAINKDVKAVPVNTDYFISENFIDGIQTKMMTLNGIETLCYVIKSHSQATEHQMGPWCPTHIEDGMEKAGIWFHEGKVYDVSGHFITNLKDFYGDDKWKLYREDGTVKVTNTEAGCIAAAKPEVEEAYNNYCVECLPEYFKDQVTTFVLPVTPTYVNTPQNFGRGGLGIALNGVNYDPPAPTHAILAAHTIAPLDDHGGHVNPHGGYHYHAATGSTKEIEQADTHAPLIGYAIDGFGIYALSDKNNQVPDDLDECGGHTDDIRGYHYHAGEPGGNQIIKCLHGNPGYTSVQE